MRISFLCIAVIAICISCNQSSKKTQRHSLPVGPVKSEKVANDRKYTHDLNCNTKLGNLMATKKKPALPAGFFNFQESS